MVLETMGVNELPVTPVDQVKVAAATEVATNGTGVALLHKV